MALTDRTIAVVGLGYVGLPLAALCARRGYPVVGLDSSERVVAALDAGKCHIRDAAVERMVAEALESGNLAATTDAARIADCNVYLVCVPTPVDADNDPDLGPLEGACEEIVAPLLREISGLEPGADFHLAHCPERINPGDPFWHSGNIPRVVGALPGGGIDLAAEFYASILGGEILDVREVKRSLYPKFRETEHGVHVSQVPLGSVTKMRTIRDAEAVKAMENTVRDVNIAFVNELAKISDVLELDVVDIIDGMATKPFGKGPFYPGVGVGGHCIAVDPEWLKAASQRAGYMPEIIQLARATNDGMPAYTVSVLQDLLNERGYPLKGTCVAVFGVAYKKNVDDPRESPFYDLRNQLRKKGAELAVYDSWVTSENTVDSIDACLDGAKAVVIVTEHSDVVGKLSALDLGGLGIEVVIDGRNCLDGDRIREQGIHYRGIGRRA